MGKYLSREAAISYVASNFTWLNSLVLFALSTSCVVTASKIMNVGEFTIFNLTFLIRNYYIVVLVITILHFFVTVYLIHSLHLIWLHCDAETRQEVFEKICFSGGFLTRGHILTSSKIESKEFSPSGKPLLLLSPLEPPIWALLILTIAVFTSLMRFELSWTAAGTYLLACALVYINWNIGAHWLFALSDLNNNNNESYYFDTESSAWHKAILPNSSGPILQDVKGFNGLLISIVFVPLVLAIVIPLIILLLPIAGARMALEKLRDIAGN